MTRARRLLYTTLQGMAVSQDDDSDTIAVAQEIRRYLKHHPQAADTLDGVIRWWLTRQRLESAWQLVERALDHLVDQGIVKKTATADGKILYSSTSKGRNDQRLH